MRMPAPESSPIISPATRSCRHRFDVGIRKRSNGMTRARRSSLFPNAPSRLAAARETARSARFYAPNQMIEKVGAPQKR